MAVPNIADPAASVNGAHPRTQIDLDGLTVLANGTITREWFSYGTSTAYGSTIDATPVVQGNFAGWTRATVTGLSPGTTYHFRARATNASGQGNAADDVTCDTNIGDPSCTTDSYSAGYTSVNVNASVTGTGGPNGSITGKRIKLYDAGLNLVADSGDLGAGSGGFSFNFTGLPNGTSFFAQAEVTNSVSTQTGNALACATFAYTAPVIGNTSTPWAKTASSITPKATATDSGTGGDYPITEVGFVYALASATVTPTIGGSGVTRVIHGSVPALGVEFSDALTGLTGGRVYAVRAYATNAIGTTYTAVFQIVTSVVTGFAETANIPTATLKGQNTIAVTGKAETAVIPTPVVSSAHLGGKAETAVIPTPTMKSPLTRTVSAFAEQAAYGRVFMYRPLAASATLVQTVTSGSFTTSSKATSITPTAGNTLIIAVYASGNITPSISDDKSNTWTKCVDTSGGTPHVSLWEAHNVAAGATSVTVSGFSNGITQRYTIREYSGLLSASSPKDKTSATNGTSTGPTATLTQADELVVCAGHQNTGASNAAPTAGSGYGNMSGFDDGAQYERGMEDKQVHVTTAVSGAMTYPGTPFSTAWTILTTFKMAAVAQPQGIVGGGFAEVANIPTATVTSKKTVAVTAFTETAIVPTPTVRSYAQITGKAETAIIPTPTVRSVNHLVLTGKAETAAIPTPTVTSRYTATVDAFSEIAVVGTVTIHAANHLALTGVTCTATVPTPTVRTYAQLTAFTETATIPTPTLHGVDHLALAGVTCTAQIGTATLHGANYLTLAGVTCTAIVGTVTPTGALTRPVSGYPQPQTIPTPTITGQYRLELPAVTQPQTIPTPALSNANVIHLTGYPETPAISPAALTSANRISLAGLPETATIPTAALHARVTIPIVGFPQPASIGLAALHGANRAVLAGVPQTATIPTPAVRSANRIVLAGFAETAIVGGVLVRVPRDFPVSCTVTLRADLRADITQRRDLVADAALAVDLRADIIQTRDLIADVTDGGDTHADIALRGAV